ncbi:MAG: SGNH/GDSL hydrolase family protein [Streptosporangiales bacterium]|nr:SGNH/GDSL hydrolase family protein [Streptosporangiales bacterium]
MKREGAFCAAAGLALAAACCAAVPASAAVSSGAGNAAPAGGAYVALGDSYTSGPVMQPSSPTASPLCDQSAVNYPHLTARALGLALTDVSCGGATVSDMTQSQYPGVAPQFGALSVRDKVVTLGIGGNDDNTFITAVAGCGALGASDPENRGAPCEKAFGDRFADNIASDGPNIGAALRRIHALAPHARVFVAGYPDILPQHGNCWPQMPMSTGDVAYLNGVERDLNGMLEREAGANGATFVDTYGPSIGHDACQPESVRWVEPAVPSSPAAFVHPNAAGEAAMASMVEEAIR